MVVANLKRFAFRIAWWWIPCVCIRILLSTLFGQVSQTAVPASAGNFASHHRMLLNLSLKSFVAKIIAENELI
jgi:hypothetical protein